jgi:hypothetical protein
MSRTPCAREVRRRVEPTSARVCARCAVLGPELLGPSGTSTCAGRDASASVGRIASRVVAGGIVIEAWVVPRTVYSAFSTVDVSGAACGRSRSRSRSRARSRSRSRARSRTWVRRQSSGGSPGSFPLSSLEASWEAPPSSSSPPSDAGPASVVPASARPGSWSGAADVDSPPGGSSPGPTQPAAASASAMHPSGPRRRVRSAM